MKVLDILKMKFQRKIIVKLNHLRSLSLILEQSKNQFKMKKILIYSFVVATLFSCSQNEKSEVKQDIKKKSNSNEVKKTDKKQNENVITGSVEVTINGESSSFKTFSKKYTGGTIAGGTIALKIIGDNEKFSVLAGVTGADYTNGLVGSYGTENGIVQLTMNHHGIGSNEMISLKEGVMKVESIEKNKMVFTINGKAQWASKLSTEETFDIELKVNIKGGHIQIIN